MKVMHLFLNAFVVYIRVKMLRCLAEAEVKGGVITRDLEQPCIDKDTGNTTTWTTAAGEGGGASKYSTVIFYAALEYIVNLFTKSISLKQQQLKEEA